MSLDVIGIALRCMTYDLGQDEQGKQEITGKHIRAASFTVLAIVVTSCPPMTGAMLLWPQRDRTNLFLEESSMAHDLPFSHGRYSPKKELRTPK